MKSTYQDLFRSLIHKGPEITMTADQLRDDFVWIDGCFDFTHHGHAGAILQARQTIKSPNGVLYCGVHNDKDIAFNKGSLPVMNSRERYEHTRANRWCGQVVEDAPYVTQPDWLDRYGCRYVVHGDDITLAADGTDCYQVMKDLGRFKVVKRTAGVSTTEIIHRILTGTGKGSRELPSIKELELYATGPDGFSKHCFVFLDDLANAIVQGGYSFDFQDCKFVKGQFDLFHMGHIEQLARIKAMEPRQARLIAVIDTRDDCIMSLKERALNVLSCKHVDGIVILTGSQTGLPADYEMGDHSLTAGTEFEYLNRDVIVRRILDQRQVYVDRNARKGMQIES